jgi:autotransporter translocation and assembly factor TamB
LGLSEALPLEADLTVKAERPGALLSAQTDEFSADPANLRIEARGDLAPFAVEGRVSGTIPRLRRQVAGKPQGDALDAAVDVQLTHVPAANQARGSITLSRPGELRPVASIDLDVRLANDETLAGVAKLEVADTRALQPVLPQVGAGRLGGEVKLAGSLDRPEFRGSFIGNDVVLSGIRFERLGGGFAADPSVVVAEAIEMRALGGVARLDGRVALSAAVPNDWTLILDHVDLSAAWVALSAVGVSLPYTTGQLNGAASAKGTWENGDLQARLSGRDLNIGTERLTAVAVRLEARQQKWKLDGEIARRPEETVTLAGAGTGLGSMWISAWSTGWRVGDFRYFAGETDRGGEAYLRADLYGRLDAPLGSVELSLVDLRVGERQIGTLSAEVHALSGGRYEIFVNDKEERLALAGEVRAEAARPFRLRAELRDFDLAHVLAPQQKVTLPAHGRAELAGRLSDPTRSLTGQIVLTQFAFGRDALRMEQAEPIVVSIRDGRVRVESFHLGGDFGSVAVAGTAGFAGDIDLGVRVDADARVLEAIPGSTVRWASGSLALDARARRLGGSSLDLEGGGSVSGLSVDIGLPFLLTDANGAFAFAGSRVTVDGIRGRAGGGDFELGGYLDVAEGPRLTWAAENVGSGFLDWLEDEVSGKGEIRGAWEELTIAGDIKVDSAIYDRDVELTDLLPIFRRQLGPAPPKPGEKAIALDLHIDAPDSIYIDNNVVRAEFRADLHIGGTDLEPRLKGELELLDGEATVFDRRFQVTKGKVDFDGGKKVNPTLEFSANTDVSTPDAEYNVVAQVVGTLDDPRVILSADDSALSTTDVAMLLTVGRTTAQMQREGPSSASNDFVGLAPMLYGSQLQRGVQRFLPIDRFTLEPGFSRTTGDFEPRITVGTEIAPRLRGTLSTTISAQTQNAVQLEYQLTPHVLAVGSWDSRTETSAGGFGGALKFRYTYRYLPHYTLLPPEWWRSDAP